MIHAVEFHSFCNAKQRCTNTKHPRYNDWGGRGIQFKFKNFKEFFSCLGEKPIGYVLDRVDNEGHYEPNNVRWIPASQSNLNQRQRKDNTSGIKNISKDSYNNWSFKYKNKRYFYGESFGDALACKLLFMETLT